MKKLIYLMTGVVLITSLISCEKEESYSDDLLESKKAIEYIVSNLESEPVSDMGIIPYIITGENRGGNRTCEEVELAFGTKFDLCGDKIDYEDGEFEGDFPDGLKVSVQGSFLSFEASGCIMIQGKKYKVGAVIVKGGSDANIYHYPDGTLSDQRLAAPSNRSGNPAGLSNLTFCFYECDEEPDNIFIAIKARYRAGSEGDYYQEPGTSSSAASAGDYIFSGSGCSRVGFNEYPTKDSFVLKDYYAYQIDVGMVTVTESENKLTITVTMKGNGELFETRFFIGSIEEALNTVPEDDDCPDYWNSSLWHIDYTTSNSVSYSIDY